MFPSSSPIPPSNDRDRAAVVTTAILQIVAASSSPLSARLQIEAYLRDEFPDVGSDQ
jgi:hypothetical protein